MTDRSAGGFSGYQRFVVAALAFVQFTLVLDFMILSPLGALLMPALHITPAQFGLLVSTYAFSAGGAGIVAAGFADRFDRKTLIIFLYGGFLLGTLLCGLASSYGGLLVARLVTGLFSGLVGAAAFAIITDLFPLHMRGRVMGIIQTSFGASTVLGIPISLIIANHWGWTAPFKMLVIVGAIAGGCVWVYLRPVDAHLKHNVERNPVQHLIHTVSNPSYLQGFATSMLLSVGGFMLLPFMSPFLVNNVGISLDKLPLVYVLVGTCSVLAGPIIGKASDAVGKFNVFGFGCLITIVMVVIYTHLEAVSLWVLVSVLGTMQIGIFSRVISASALISALPEPADRGAYMAIGSSLQQMAGGIGSAVAGLIVVQSTGGRLIHMDTLGYILVCTTLLTLVMMYFLNRKLTLAQIPRTDLKDIATSEAAS